MSRPAVSESLSHRLGRCPDRPDATHRGRVHGAVVVHRTLRLCAMASVGTTRSSSELSCSPQNPSSWNLRATDLSVKAELRDLFRSDDPRKNRGSSIALTRVEQAAQMSVLV